MEIKILTHKKYSLRSIAGALERSVSTISDELKRNKVKGIYDAKKAQHKAYVRRQEAKYQGMKIVDYPPLHSFVEENLWHEQSPHAIAGRIRRREKHLPSISGDSIYRYIASVYGRKIEAHRRRKRPKHRTRRTKLKKIDDRVFIDKRPLIINKRMRIGDAEADFIVSRRDRKGILLVVVDRKLRAVFLELILIVTIERVHAAFVRIKKRYGEMRTATTDNDILLQRHRELAALLEVKIYFCHPYHSWEKGSVENANKHIRKYIPKGSDLSRYSKRFIRSVEGKLNDRILACLDYRTPHEMLERARKQKKRLRALKKKQK